MKKKYFVKIEIIESTEKNLLLKYNQLIFENYFSAKK
jgi:hypothetical protein